MQYLMHGPYKLDARVVENADAGGREVGSPQQLVAVEVRAEVGQHRLRPQVLADDVRHVPAVGEAAGGAVRRVVDAVRRRVGARRRGKVVVCCRCPPASRRRRRRREEWRRPAAAAGTPPLKDGGVAAGGTRRWRLEAFSMSILAAACEILILLLMDHHIYTRDKS